MILSQAASATDGLLQFGAVGIVAILALGAVRILFVRLTTTLERAEARADRLEKALLDSNQAVQDKYLTTVAEATRVMAAVLYQLRDDDRSIDLRKEHDR